MADFVRVVLCPHVATHNEPAFHYKHVLTVGAILDPTNK